MSDIRWRKKYLGIELRYIVIVLGLVFLHNAGFFSIFEGGIGLTQMIRGGGDDIPNCPVETTAKFLDYEISYPQTYGHEECKEGDPYAWDLIVKKNDIVVFQPEGCGAIGYGADDLIISECGHSGTSGGFIRMCYEIKLPEDKVTADIKNDNLVVTNNWYPFKGNLGLGGVDVPEHYGKWYEYDFPLGETQFSVAGTSLWAKIRDIKISTTDWTGVHLFLSGACQELPGEMTLGSLDLGTFELATTTTTTEPIVTTTIAGTTTTQATTTTIRECVVASDCEGRYHAACTGEWSCSLDGKCKWLCKEEEFPWQFLIVGVVILGAAIYLFKVSK